MRRRLLYILSLFLACPSLWAGDLFFRHIGMADGLPQMTVNDICRDELGAMWFATRQGLAHYTGSIDNVYVQADTDTAQIFSPVVDRVCTDAHGNVYRLAGGICAYSLRKGSWLTICLENCDAMACSADGVYFVSRGRGYYYDALSQRMDTLFRLPDDCARPSRILPLDNMLFLGCVDGKMYSYAQGTYSLTFLRALGSHISEIYEDSYHRIWVATWENGLYCYNRSEQQKWSQVSGLSSSFVRSVVEDSQHTIWIGTDHGIENLDHPGQRYLADESVWKLYCDEEDNIWIGTYFGGVYCFNARISPYTLLPIDTNHFPVISSIAQSQGNSYYLCTEGQGLWRYSLGKGVTQRWQLPNIKTSYYDEAQHRLYIGTHLGGVYCLDEATSHLYHYSMPNPSWQRSDIVRSIIPYNDSILVGTYNGLYIMPRSGGKMQLLSEHLHRHMPYIVSMAEDNQHRLWLGGYDLVCYDRQTDCVQKISTPFNSIESLLVDYQGVVWIGTDGSGVWSYSPKLQQFTEYSSSNCGLQSDFVRRLLITHQGNLMILTTRGFSILQLDSLSLTNYVPGLYLPLSSIYNGGATVTSAGEILLAGMDGLLLFREENLPHLASHPRIVLNRLLVDAREVYPEDASHILRLSLPYTDTIYVGSRQNFIDIQLYVDNYATSSLEQIRYSIERRREKWVYLLENKPTIHLMNLPYGDNRLVVQVVDKNTSQVLSERVLLIHRHTPWYHSTWFYVLVSLLLFGGVLIILIWEERRLKSVIRSRDELLRDAFRTRVMQYVNAHLMDSELDVAALCKELGLGRSKLFRQIKEDFGVTPQHLIQETRLQRAAEWLVHRQELNISEIAYDLGYQSPKYFARCFKDRFGMTPTQYRKQHTDDGNV